MLHLDGRAAKRLAGLTAIALLSGGLLGVHAASAADSGLKISGAHMRYIISDRPAAGYFSLKNETDTPRMLVAASSPACKTLMLHRSISKNGMESMVHVKEVPVPAHQSITFAPGGYHLMCMSPSMKVGQTVSVTLSFKNGEKLTSGFPVHGPMG